MKPAVLPKIELKSSIRLPQEMRGSDSEIAFADLLVERKIPSQTAVADKTPLRTSKDEERSETVETDASGELEQFWISKNFQNAPVETELPVASLPKESDTPNLVSLNLVQPEPTVARLELAATDGWEPLPAQSTLKTDSVPQMLQAPRNPAEMKAGSQIQTVRYDNFIAPAPEEPGSPNSLAVVTVGLKPGAERKQIFSLQEQLPRKENLVVTVDVPVSQKNGSPDIVPFALLHGADLNERFTQLIASEMPLQGTGKPAEISLHFKHEKDGPVIKRLKLQLQPENLGELSVEIHRQEDGLRIVVQAQTAAAHAKFTAEQDEILRSLDLVGVKISEISIQPFSGIAKDTDTVDGGQSLHSAFGQSGQGKSGSQAEQNPKSSRTEDGPKSDNKSGVYI